MSAGDYLRRMREAEELSIRNVADTLRMLKLCGLGRTWPIGKGLEQLLERMEAGDRRLTEDQVLSLRLIFPLRIHDYRHHAAKPEKADG